MTQPKGPHELTSLTVISPMASCLCGAWFSSSRNLTETDEDVANKLLAKFDQHVREGWPGD